jgi:hypothetical protein
MITFARATDCGGLQTCRRRVPSLYAVLRLSKRSCYACSAYRDWAIPGSVFQGWCDDLDNLGVPRTIGLAEVLVA